MYEKLIRIFSQEKQRILQESFEIYQDYSDFLRFYSLEIAPTVLILGEGEEVEEFAAMLDSYEKINYQVGVLSPKEVVAINGHLGQFEAKIKREDSLFSLQFAQMVLFYEDENLKRFMGCENVQDYKTPQDLIDVLDSRVGTYSYHNIIHYNADKCQYHHRRPDKKGEGYCHACVDSCPTFGVSKNDSLMELQFSALDCISCGACVMACPTGSVQRDGYDKESLYEIAKLYKNIVPVVVDASTSQDVLDIDFGNTLAFVVAQTHLLNETYLLSIVQESSAQVVIYDPKKNTALMSAVEFLNNIFQKKYQRDAVLLAHNKEKLQEKIKLAGVYSDFAYTYRQGQKDALRHIFSERLKFVVKDDILGFIPNTYNTYGRVIVNQDKCTLCMSCVGACNVQSLSAGDFSLMHNPSLCTTCGYCVDSCPEQAISVKFDGINLEPKWFEHEIVARDRGFECVECGKIFANTKAVEKIKNMMTPIFKNDAARLRSLECCETCKVKVMFGVQS
ncbi:4Fe-4S binding protein [Helicobacter anatolicus]|uniref:4Fe-4S binding protein n=1 Tax=Helicobacter anatolicus TaxID=2905874 RepID=UPI001E4F512C|nr:4Fe-4S binding protein [Helicobacter anatolicus]MCE3039764.1 4Fe-4S binding protein [Helicobacter anatolicus]